MALKMLQKSFRIWTTTETQEHILSIEKRNSALNFAKLKKRNLLSTYAFSQKFHAVFIRIIQVKFFI